MEEDLIQNQIDMSSKKKNLFCREQWVTIGAIALLVVLALLLATFFDLISKEPIPVGPSQIEIERQEIVSRIINQEKAPLSPEDKQQMLRWLLHTEHKDVQFSPDEKAEIYKTLVEPQKSP